MNIEKLRQVQRVLRGINPEKFNMYCWMDDDGDGCAIGHCCKDSWFIENGLGLAESYDSLIPCLDGTQIEWNALMVFFEINFDTATYLFGSISYRSGSTTTPQQVIDRIEEVINEK